jgi:hypothetical protein
MYLRANPRDLESVSRPPIPTLESAGREALNAGFPANLLGGILRDRLALEFTSSNADRHISIRPRVWEIPAGLLLRAGKRDLAFGAEDIAIKARNPLPSARRHVEITYFGPNMRRHAVPVKLRVAIDDVGG